MKSGINELISMRDTESLFDLMTEHEDWMTQIDAAEGLVKCGDKRGYEFLLDATLSEDEETAEVAQEVLASPELAQMRREIEAEQEREHRTRIEAAKNRLQKGGKVFRYKMVYLPAGDILNEDPMSEGFDVPALDDFGLEGWELVHIIPRRRAVLVGSDDDQFTGAYFLLKKEVLQSESTDLDKA
jgi:hypothetical protein